MKRIPIRDIIIAAASDAEHELDVRKAMHELASELNWALACFEVTIENFDGENFLALRPVKEKLTAGFPLEEEA